MLNAIKDTFLPGPLVNGTFEKRTHAGLLNIETFKKLSPVMFKNGCTCLFFGHVLKCLLISYEI